MNGEVITITRNDIRQFTYVSNKEKMPDVLKRLGIPAESYFTHGAGHGVKVLKANWELWACRQAGVSTANIDRREASKEFFASIIRRLDRCEEALDLLHTKIDNIAHNLQHHTQRR